MGVATTVRAETGHGATKPFRPVTRAKLFSLIGQTQNKNSLTGLEGVLSESAMCSARNEAGLKKQNVIM
jgi:hypothetical protein